MRTKYIQGIYSGEIRAARLLVRVKNIELTENTEAYGLKLLESTDRIDAARHTTEGTEMIACTASPKAANYA